MLVSIIYTLDLLFVLSFIPAVVGAALIGGASSIAGGLLAKKGASDANSAQVALARENREFERATAYEMMQKRHQWEVDDLKAAGLNPILSTHAAPSMGNVGADTPPLRNEYEQAGPMMASGAQQIFDNVMAYRQQQNLNNVASEQAGYYSAQSALLGLEKERLVQDIAANLPAGQRAQMDASAEESRARTIQIGVLNELTKEQINESRARRGELEAKMFEIYQNINVLRAQERSLDQKRQLDYLYGLESETRRELDMLRIRGQEFENINRQLVNLELMLGMPEKEFYKNLHEAGKFHTEAIEWAYKGILDWIGSVFKPNERAMGIIEDTRRNRDENRRNMPDFELVSGPNTQWTHAYD